MDRTITRLLDTIKEEKTIYREMIDILSEERDAATRSDRDRLVVVGQTKQALVQRIKRTENRREALVGELAGSLCIRERPLTISLLCAYVQEPAASQLKACAEQLKSLVGTIQRENTANARLFAHSLELIHGSLKLINELVYSHAVYGKPGCEQRTQGYAGNRGNVFCRSV